MATVCPGCQTEVAEDAIFCHQCGQKLTESAQTTQDIDPKQRLASAVPPRNEDDDAPEQELWQGQYSKLAMVGTWICAALITVVILIAAAVLTFTGVAWAIAIAALALMWLGLLARLWYRQLSEHYYLTDQRFVHERGLLWREINRIEAIDVDDVSYQQGPIERMFGVGTISISSSDRSHPMLDLPGIEKVQKVAGMIDEVRRQERRKRGLYVESI